MAGLDYLFLGVHQQRGVAPDTRKTNRIRVLCAVHPIATRRSGNTNTKRTPNCTVLGVHPCPSLPRPPITRQSPRPLRQREHNPPNSSPNHDQTTPARIEFTTHHRLPNRRRRAGEPDNDRKRQHARYAGATPGHATPRNGHASSSFLFLTAPPPSVTVSSASSCPFVNAVGWSVPTRCGMR